MSKPKKTSRYSPFAQYMRERLPQLRDEGRAHNILECVPICRPEWQIMTKDKQKEYDHRAKLLKQQEQETGTEVKYSRGSKNAAKGDDLRLNNQGALISETMEVMLHIGSRREQDRAFARSRWPKNFEDLYRVPFYVVHFQYACEIHEAYQSREWRPVEVSIIGFRMDTGILQKYHKFINPGEFPTGYHADCLDRTEKVHQIPHAGFELASSDYARLWRDINIMVDSEPPILYCMEEHKEIAQFCLHWVHMQGCHPGPFEQNTFRVFSLEDCIQDLIERTGKTVSTGSITDVLESSIYDYEAGTRCKFHEDQDTLNCSLAITNRWAFALSVLLSKKEFFDFELTSNYIPMVKADKKTLLERPASKVADDDDDTLSVRSSATTVKSSVFGARDFRYFQSADDDTESISSTKRKVDMPAAMFNPAQAASSKQSKSRGRGVLKSDEEEEWPTLGQTMGKATPANKGTNAWGGQQNNRFVGVGRGRGVISQTLAEELSRKEKPAAPWGQMSARSSGGAWGDQKNSAANYRGNGWLDKGMRGLNDDEDDDLMDPVHPVLIVGGRGKKI